MKFKFNNNSSDDYNLIVRSDNHLDRQNKRIELVKIEGRTGDLIIADGSYDNLQVTLSCYLDCRNGKLNASLDKLHEWLDIDGYKLLEFEDGVKFNAVFLNLSTVGKFAKNIREVEITFSCYKGGI